MISEEKIRDLLAKWEEARENGVEIPPEDLTGNLDERDELRIRIAGIKAFQKFKQALIPSVNTVHFPKIPGFKLLKELARGGMGVVYQAEQQVNKSSRLVAIKMIRGQFAADPEYLRRFRFEAEALVSLEHPNIVRVYEVGDDDGHPYFAMQYVDVKTIEKPGAGSSGLEREGQRQIALLFVKVATAIDFAHQRGIIHRDVKPGNILVATDGTPFVTDFGLATSLQTESIQTPAGLILGTPSYMAPEVASGQEKGTIKSDVYGIGAVLYEMLTGRPPYRGSDLVQTLLQITEGKLIRPRSLNSQIDSDLETICLKSLREKETRYNSAKELAVDLQCWLDGKPISAREFSATERFWRLCKRNRIAASLSTALVMTVIVTFFLIGRETNRAELNAVKAKAEAALKEQAVLARRRSELLAEFLFVSDKYMKGDKKGATEQGMRIIDQIKILDMEIPEHNPSRALLALAYFLTGMMKAENQLNGAVNVEIESLMSLVQRRPIEKKTRMLLEESLEYLDKAAMIQELIRQEWPDTPLFALEKDSLISDMRATLLGLLHRFTESLQAVDQTISLTTDPEKLSELARLRLRQLRAAEGEQAENLKPRATPRDHIKDIKLASYLAESKDVSDAAIYNAACTFALAAGEVNITEKERETRAAQSMKYLVAITDRGYFHESKKRRELAKDAKNADLKSLRSRPDFNELVDRVGIKDLDTEIGKHREMTVRAAR